MVEIKNPKDCCGCSACFSVCPHGAISMRKDVLGFSYPVTDYDKCVECGLCLKVCDFKEKKSLEKDRTGVVDVLAVVNRNKSVLSQSQSGGAFTALSDYILSKEGVVYGSAFDKDWTVVHKRASNHQDRDSFRGSKYVESDLGNVFSQVLNDLKTGRYVMFSGTPCQVAGLNAFVPAKFKEKLYLVDFICHGVPSPAVWSDYLKYMQRKGPVVKADFRDKAVSGWKVHKESFTYSNGKKISRETYKVLFYKNIMLRHSCGECPYDIYSRAADITLADFWGIETVLQDFDSSEGASMIVCRTVKGNDLFTSVADALVTTEAALDSEFFKKYNPGVLGPSRIDVHRMQFEREYAEKGFLHIARRWSDMGWRYHAWRLKKFIKNLSGNK